MAYYHRYYTHALSNSVLSSCGRPNICGADLSCQSLLTYYDLIFYFMLWSVNSKLCTIACIEWHLLSLWSAYSGCLDSFCEADASLTLLPCVASASSRGAQNQFLENIFSEDDLRYRIFGTFVVKLLACLPLLSLRSADVFPVVASLPPKIFFGGREATTGNTSVLRRLASPRIFEHLKNVIIANL